MLKGATVGLLMLSCALAWPPKQTGPELPRPVINSILPAFGEVGHAHSITVHGTGMTEEMGFGSLLCRFNYTDLAGNIKTHESIARRLLDGCLPSGNNGPACRSTRAVCTTPVADVAQRMLVRVTNYDPRFRNEEAFGFPEQQSTESVYFAFVPSVAPQRFAATVGNKTNIIVRGAGMRAVTDRSLVCVFIDSGIGAFFSPSTSLAHAVSQGGDCAPGAATCTPRRRRDYQVKNATPVGSGGGAVTCEVPDGVTARVYRVSICADFLAGQTCNVAAPCNSPYRSFALLTYLAVLDEALTTTNETLPNKGPVGSSVLVTLNGQGFIENDVQVIETYGGFAEADVARDSFREPTFSGNFTLGWRGKQVSVSSRSSAAMLKHRIVGGLGADVTVVLVASQYQGGRKWMVSFHASAAAADGSFDQLEVVSSILQPAAKADGTGALVMASPVVRCKFGEDIIIPISVRRSGVKCFTPVRRETERPDIVAISFDEGLTFSRGDTNPPFFYYPTVHLIYPHRNSQRGGVKIFVEGTGFYNTSTLRCRFGLRGFAEVDQPAEFVNKRLISCRSPAAKTLGPNFIPSALGNDTVVDVEVSTNGFVFSDTMQYLWRRPLDREGQVHLRPDLEQRGRRPIYNQLAYYATPVLYRLFPSSGPRRGGTPLKIFGKNFVNHGGLRCLFDTGGSAISSPSAQRNLGYDVTHVRASWVNDGLVVCPTPASLAAVTSGSTLSVSVRVTNNFNRPGDGQPRPQAWDSASFMTDLGTTVNQSPRYGLGDYSMPLAYTYIPDLMNTAVTVNGDALPHDSQTGEYQVLKTHLGGRIEVTLVTDGLAPSLRKDGELPPETLVDGAREHHAKDRILVVARNATSNVSRTENATDAAQARDNSAEMRPDVAQIYGGLALVWQEETQFGALRKSVEIMLACFDHKNNRQLGDQMVSEPRPYANNIRPTVQTLDDGFVVVWQKRIASSSNATCATWQVLGQRYDSHCRVEGNVFRVSAPSWVEPAHVVLQLDGGFAVVFQAQDSGIHLPHASAAGNTTNDTSLAPSDGCDVWYNTTVASTLYVQHYAWSGDPEDYDSEIGTPYRKAFDYTQGYSGRAAQPVDGTKTDTLAYSFSASAVEGGFVVVWSRASTASPGIRWAYFATTRGSAAGVSFRPAKQASGAVASTNKVGNQVTACRISGGFILGYVRDRRLFVSQCQLSGAQGCGTEMSVLSPASAAIIRPMFSPRLVSLDGGFVILWSALNRDDTSPRSDLSACPIDCHHEWIGDGYCDAECNTKNCGYWDGGDCCEYTCTRDHPQKMNNRRYQCGRWGYDCRQGPEDTSSIGIYGKQYMVRGGQLIATGIDRSAQYPSEHAEGQDFRVNTQTFGHQKNLRASAASGGGFFAVYESLAIKEDDPFLNRTVERAHEVHLHRFADYPLRCRFGVKTVRARYINNTAVACVAPPYHRQDTVAVHITNNEVDYSDTGLKISYQETCPVGRFCPNQEQWNRSSSGVVTAACPRGHFCPTQDALFPTACLPGTYQPFEGTTECILCPIGHQCPRFEMQRPEECPAGFVCDRAGLTTTTKLCPAGHYCTRGMAIGLGDCPESQDLPLVREGDPTKADPGCWRRVPVPLANVVVRQGSRTVTAADANTDFRALVRRGWFLVIENKTYMVAYSGPLTATTVTLQSSYTGTTPAAGITLVAQKAYNDSSGIKRPRRCPVRTYCGPGVRQEKTIACNKFTRGLWRSGEASVPYSAQHCINFSLSVFDSLPLRQGEQVQLKQGNDYKWGEISAPSNGSNATYDVLLSTGDVAVRVPRGSIQLCSTGQCYLTPQPCEAGYFCFNGSQTPRGISPGFIDGKPCPPKKFCPSNARTSQPTATTSGSSGGGSRRLTTAGDEFACPWGESCPRAQYHYPGATEKCRINEYVKLNLLHRNCSQGLYGNQSKADNSSVCSTAKSEYCVQDSPRLVKVCTDADRADPFQFTCDCPMGHYCPPKALEPQPCAIGTYNDLTNQQECLGCKPGFTCPVTTMVVMQPCKAGSICDEERLSTEKRKCLKGFYCLGGVITTETHCSAGARVDGRPQGITCDYAALAPRLLRTPYARLAGSATSEKFYEMEDVIAQSLYIYGKEDDILPAQLSSRLRSVERMLDVNRALHGWVEIAGQYFDTERTWAGYKVGFVDRSGPQSQWLWHHTLLDFVAVPCCTAAHSCRAAPVPGQSKSFRCVCTNSSATPAPCDIRSHVKPGDVVEIAGLTYNVARSAAGFTTTQVPLETPFVGVTAQTNVQSLDVTVRRCAGCVSAHESYLGKVQRDVASFWRQHRVDKISLSLSANLQVLKRALVPLPCPPGYYCPTGTERPEDAGTFGSTPHGKDENPDSFAFKCVPGTYCKRGTEASGGTALCPPGQYCPAGVFEPLDAPPGKFAEGAGSRLAQACFTGFYAASRKRSKCSKCPKGFMCPTVNQTVSTGAVAKQVMHVGRNDTIICPPGTICTRTGKSGASGRCPAGHFCLEGTYSSCTQFIGRKPLDPRLDSSLNGTTTGCMAFPHPNTTHAIIYQCPGCPAPSQCDVREIVNRGEPLEFGGKRFTIARLESQLPAVAFTGDQIPVEEPFLPQHPAFSPARRALSRSGVSGVLLRVPCAICTVDQHCLTKLAKGKLLPDRVPVSNISGSPMVMSRRGDDNANWVAATLVAREWGAVATARRRSDLAQNASEAQPSATTIFLSTPRMIDNEFWSSQTYPDQTPKEFLVIDRPNEARTQWEYLRVIRLGRRAEEIRRETAKFCVVGPFVPAVEASQFCEDSAVKAFAAERARSGTWAELVKIDYDIPLKLDFIQFTVLTHSDAFVSEQMLAGFPALPKEALRVEIRVKENPADKVVLRHCQRAARLDPTSHPSDQQRCSEEFDAKYCEFKSVRHFRDAIYVNGTLWKDEELVNVTQLIISYDRTHPVVQKYLFLQSVRFFKRDELYQPGKITLAKLTKAREQEGDFQQDLFPSTCCMRPIPCDSGSYCQAGVKGPQIEFPPTRNFEAPQWCVEGTYCARGSKSPQGSGQCPAGFYCPAGSVAPRPCWKGHECPLKGNKLPSICASGKYSIAGVFPPKTTTKVSNIQSLTYKQYQYRPDYGRRRCLEGSFCCSKPCTGCIPPAKPDGHWRDCGYIWAATGPETFRYTKMSVPVCSALSSSSDVRLRKCVCMAESQVCSPAEIAKNAAARYDTKYIGEACALPHFCIDSREFDDISICKHAQSNGLNYGCIGEQFARAERFLYGGNYDWDFWPVDETSRQSLCYNNDKIPQHGALCPDALGKLPPAYNKRSNWTLATTCAKSGFLGSLTCPDKEIQEGKGVVDNGIVTIKGSAIDDLSGLFKEAKTIRQVQNARYWDLIRDRGAHHGPSGTDFLDEMCAEGSVTDCDGMCLSPVDCLGPGRASTPAGQGGCKVLLNDGVCHDGTRETAPGVFPNFDCEVHSFDGHTKDSSDCRVREKDSTTTWKQFERFALVAACMKAGSMGRWAAKQQGSRPGRFALEAEIYAAHIADMVAHPSVVGNIRVWLADLLNRASRKPALGPVTKANDPSAGEKGGGRLLEHQFCVIMNTWETYGYDSTGKVSYRFTQELRGSTPLASEIKVQRFIASTAQYTLNHGLLGVGFIGSGMLSRWPVFPAEFLDEASALTFPGASLTHDANAVNVSNPANASFWLDQQGTSARSYHVDTDLGYGAHKFDWNVACGVAQPPCFENITQRRPFVFRRAYSFPQAQAHMGSIADISLAGSGDTRIYDLHLSNATFEIWFRLRHAHGQHVLFETGREGWGWSLLLDNSTLILRVDWILGRFDFSGLLQSRDASRTCSRGTTVIKRQLSHDALHNFQLATVTFEKVTHYGPVDRRALYIGLFVNGRFVDAAEVKANNREDSASWSDGFMVRPPGGAWHPCLDRDPAVVGSNATFGGTNNTQAGRSRRLPPTLLVGAFAGLGTIGEVAQPRHAGGLDSAAKKLLAGAAGAQSLSAAVQEFSGQIAFFNFYALPLTPNEVTQNFMAHTMPGHQSIASKGIVRTRGDDFVGAVSCLPCPRGHYCPIEGISYPIPCPPGTFMGGGGGGSLECTPCPEGTYSLDERLEQESECKPCPPGKVCEESGNRNLDVTEQTKTSWCPEGYFCSLGTKKASEREFPCPRGTFCARGTTPPADFDVQGEWDIKKCDCKATTQECTTWSDGGFQCECKYTQNKEHSVEGYGIVNLKGFPQCNDDSQTENAYKCIQMRKDYPNRVVSFLTLTKMQEVCNWRYTGQYTFTGSIQTAGRGTVQGGEEEQVLVSSLYISRDRVTNQTRCRREMIEEEGGCMEGVVRGQKGTVMYGKEKFFNPKSVVLEWKYCGSMAEWVEEIHRREQAQMAGVHSSSTNSTLSAGLNGSSATLHGQSSDAELDKLWDRDRPNIAAWCQTRTQTVQTSTVSNLKVGLRWLLFVVRMHFNARAWS